MIKKFYSKDFIYNNGIINFSLYLEDINYPFTLTSNYLEIDIEDNKFYDFLANFLKVNKIVHQTNNDRYYFDETKKDFILDKKFDTIGGSKNDMRNGIYLYKKIDEFNLSREEVEEKYLNFCQKYGLTPEKERDSKLKVPNKKNEVIIHITLDEATTRFAKYLVKSDTLKLDSKIHIFEDGQNSFHDMLKPPKNYNIDKWDALIYWFGGKINRWFNKNFFIYPNSQNLLYLKRFKKYINITNESIESRDKNNKIITLPTNIDFYAQLQKYNIHNHFFYISKSEYEFLLKLFIYLFSYFYNIEDRTLNGSKKAKKRFEELFELLYYVSFIVYEDDGTFRTSLFEFNKTYKIFQILKLLKEHNLFESFIEIITKFSMLDSEVIAEKFAKRFLNFLELRRIYFESAFLILKDDKQKNFKNLYQFEDIYLSYIKGEIMSLHKDSKVLGDGIGYVCGALDDKDLLFKLRNIKNYKQMISFFKDFKFELLKADKIGVSKEFNEALDRVLENIDKNWEIVRDYIAIYAVDKYKSVKYAKGE